MEWWNDEVLEHSVKVTDAGFWMPDEDRDFRYWMIAVLDAGSLLERSGNPHLSAILKSKYPTPEGSALI